MNTKFEFLKILESFMHDKSYELPADFSQLEELFKLSLQHQMGAAVYEQIRMSRICRETEFIDLLTQWKKSAIRDVMIQMQKTDGFFRIYEKLIAAGLTPLVVKGLICRNLYSKPDYRISGDEDILLPKEQFEACDRILLKEGFERGAIDKDQLPYEIPYLNRQNRVYIEVHFSLFSEESGAYGHLNQEFEEVFEHKISDVVQGKTVWTLSPTEHMFYLICHSFKHFLHSGFGVRQVCDMVKMAEAYGAQIDWKRVGERLEALNMAEYWSALVKIGERYLGMSCEKAMYPESMRGKKVEIEPLLYDLLESGIYGDSSDERKHSSNMTLAAAINGKTDTVASVCASLFPSRTYMKRAYPWLTQYPWLLPVAYMIRLFRYMKKTKIQTDESSSVKIGMERVELLRTYHIIK